MIQAIALAGLTIFLLIGFICLYALTFDFEMTDLELDDEEEYF